MPVHIDLTKPITVSTSSSAQSAAGRIVVYLYTWVEDDPVRKNRLIYLRDPLSSRKGRVQQDQSLNCSSRGRGDHRVVARELGRKLDMVPGTTWLFFVVPLLNQICAGPSTRAWGVWPFGGTGG